MDLSGNYAPGGVPVTVPFGDTLGVQCAPRRTAARAILGWIRNCGMCRRF